MTTTTTADRDLVEGLQRHDLRAAERLVEKYAGWIHRVVRRWLTDTRDVEEVTQDVLFTATRKIGQFDGRAALSTWLYRIAVNQARDRLRQKRARAEIALEPSLQVLDAEGRRADLVEDWSRRDGDPVASAETRLALAQTIDSLPAEYRVVVVLHDVKQLSNEEVAATLKLSVPAVKSRLHRARLVLRRKLAHLFTPRERRCLRPAVSTP